MNVSEHVQAFVKQRFHKEVAATDSLLDSGLMDSVGIYELVAFLEERFGVEIPDEDVIPEHFETIESLDALVSRLRQSRPAT